MQDYGGINLVLHAFLKAIIEINFAQTLKIYIFEYC